MYSPYKNKKAKVQKYSENAVSLLKNRYTCEKIATQLLEYRSWLQASYVRDSALCFPVTV